MEPRKLLKYNLQDMWPEPHL